MFSDLRGGVKTLFSNFRGGVDIISRISRGGQIFFFNFWGGHQEIDEKCPKYGLKWPKNIILKGVSTNIFRTVRGGQYFVLII